MEEVEIWPEGLLDAHLAMILKVDGDATFPGLRPLCVLPAVYRSWPSAQVTHLEDWVRSLVPDSVKSAGRRQGLSLENYGSAYGRGFSLWIPTSSAGTGQWIK